MGSHFEAVSVTGPLTAGKEWGLGWREMEPTGRWWWWWMLCCGMTRGDTGGQDTLTAADHKLHAGLWYFQAIEQNEGHDD